MLPDLSSAQCAALREALRRARYDTGGVPELLGAHAHAALGRGEPAAARRASAVGDELGVLVRLFLIGDREPESAVSAALRPLELSDALAAGLVRADADGIRAALDLRPYGDEHGDWWVISDLDPEVRGAPADADHVVGVGQASVSLATAIPRRPAGSVLDLGTGCGVQALHAHHYADTVTATDVSPRAIAMAEATFALNQLDVELLAGPWFDPVATRRFDQVVCNPPFVIGTGEVMHVYRDSGMPGDTASAHLVRTLPEHLTVGGTGHVLASWLHVRGEHWAERVAEWLPASGVDSWVLQRDVADPALYIGTWQRDSGVDPRSAAARAQADAWLDYAEAAGVEGIGFGFITMRRTDAPRSTLVCEDMRQQYGHPLGTEVAGWLDRAEWLRLTDNEALLESRLVVADDVRLERTLIPSTSGWQPTRALLTRTTGPGWRHESDEAATMLLAGCTGALPLREVFELVALSQHESTDLLISAGLPAIRELVAHGLLIPEGSA